MYDKLKNIQDYKGQYYKDNSEKLYYEGGAHFSYKDLFKRLIEISKILPPDRIEKNIVVKNSDNFRINTINHLEKIQTVSNIYKEMKIDKREVYKSVVIPVNNSSKNVDLLDKIQSIKDFNIKTNKRHSESNKTFKQFNENPNISNNSRKITIHKTEESISNKVSMNSMILKDIERYNLKSRNSGSILKKVQFNTEKTAPDQPYKIKKILEGNIIQKKTTEIIKFIKKENPKLSYKLYNNNKHNRKISKDKILKIYFEKKNYDSKMSIEV